MKISLPLLALLFAVIASPLRAADPDPLAESFVHPPAAAKPQTWWHWMNGNITREGITADLEAMRRIGLGGAQIFSVEQEIPPGPVKYATPAWRAMVKHAAQKAHDLGLSLSIHNADGWSSTGGPWITPEMSMQKIVTAETTCKGPAAFAGALPAPPSSHHFYRDIAVLAFLTPEKGQGIADFKFKAGYERRDNLEPAANDATPPAQCIAPGASVDLTDKFDPATGRLTWDAPAGDWTILRLGCTTTGAENSTATPEGRGLECDKLNPAAADLHFAHVLQKLCDDLGPQLMGGSGSIENVVIDSYEVGCQNWTPALRAEFRSRRGYDLWPWLPVFSNRVVKSLPETERFLWDFRRTLAELFSQNYYARFSQLCHDRGLKLSIEPYGNGNFDDLAVGELADTPMGEFWQHERGAVPDSCWLAASAGHLYDRPIIATESFTSAPDRTPAWSTTPFSLKALGDKLYCAGINRFIMHRYAHQPWVGGHLPGMTMGQWGLHFERTNTWWETGAAWVEYLARCQSLLQQGRFAADFLLFCGEGEPTTVQPNTYGLAGLADSCNADALFYRLSVRGGQLVLPNGASYHALFLPPDRAAMTPALLRRLRELILAGAVVYGPPPQRSPSLSDYPACDGEIAALAKEIWGDCDGQNVVEHRCGAGRVLWTLNSKERPADPVALVRQALELAPDFAVWKDARPAQPHIHRIIGDRDVYFVSNPSDSPQELECQFRVTGKAPELWRPDTGQIEPAPEWREGDDTTTVRLDLDAAGSVFVVFRPNPESNEDHPTGEVANDLEDERTRPRFDETVIPAAGVFVRAAYYETMDITAQLRKALAAAPDRKVKFNNALAGSDPALNQRKHWTARYYVDGTLCVASGEEDATLDFSSAKGHEVPPPLASELDVPASGHPGQDPNFRVRHKAEGQWELLAWQPGLYGVYTSHDKLLAARAFDVPPPVPVTGYWELHFQPGMGVWADEPVFIEPLRSWTEDTENEGVRYFSGTARYVKHLDIQPELLRADREVYLDLGEVKDLAHVWLNGQNLGVLWKPPFRVEITGAAHAGLNLLEVEVTNQWANRLIGDEQLPPDCEWEGKRLKAWPQWLLEGKISPTGRVTFSTWHHYNKDDKLLPSGLLGPVTLRFAEKVPLTPAE